MEGRPEARDYRKKGKGPTLPRIATRNKCKGFQKNKAAGAAHPGPTLLTRMQEMEAYDPCEVRFKVPRRARHTDVLLSEEEEMEETQAREARPAECASPGPKMDARDSRRVQPGSPMSLSSCSDMSPSFVSPRKFERSLTCSTKQSLTCSTLRSRTSSRQWSREQMEDWTITAAGSRSMSRMVTEEPNGLLDEHLRLEELGLNEGRDESHEEASTWVPSPNGSISIQWLARDGTILWANRDVLTMLGYTADEYIGKCIAEIHVDPISAQEILRMLVCGETVVDWQARLKHKDGSIVYGLISSSSFFDAAGHFVHMRLLTRNVTPAKLAAALEKERNSQIHAQHLEQLNLRLQREAELNLALLHQVMPAKVASDLRAGRKVPPEVFDHVTIFFSDIEGFTQIAAAVEPADVIRFLNDLYIAMDYCAALLPVYKVETIGDAYMVVGGLPDRSNGHTAAVADFALLVREVVKLVANPLWCGVPVKIRIGIHSGPVIAGIVGNLMPRYCLFGDTVNTASRMESTGASERIHCSTQVAQELERCGGYSLELRGAVEVKGKGSMTTYWLQAAAASNARCGETKVARVVAEVKELIAAVPQQRSYQNVAIQLEPAVARNEAPPEATTSISGARTDAAAGEKLPGRLKLMMCRRGVGESWRALSLTCGRLVLSGALVLGVALLPHWLRKRVRAQ